MKSIAKFNFGCRNWEQTKSLANGVRFTSLPKRKFMVQNCICLLLWWITSKPEFTRVSGENVENSIEFLLTHLPNERFSLNVNSIDFDPYLHVFIEFCSKHLTLESFTPNTFNIERYQWKMFSHQAIQFIAAYSLALNGIFPFFRSNFKSWINGLYFTGTDCLNICFRKYAEFRGKNV